MSSSSDLNYTRGHTKIIDSDFRAGAILYSLTNALLFSFSVVCTFIFIKLGKKTNISVGVNVLAMTVISVIVSIISLGLLLYSIYKLVLTKEYRDHIVNQLVRPAGVVGYKSKITDPRDLPWDNGESQQMNTQTQRNLPIRRGVESDSIDLSAAGIF